MTPSDGSIAIRALNLPDDLAELERLDIGFVTHAIYDVMRDSRGFSLVESTIKPPLRKKYSVDWRAIEAASAAIVAEIDGTIAGVASLNYEGWNRRAVVSHLYVDAAARRRGIGSRLLQELRMRANVFGARSLFVETQNVNLPAIRFYERNGFTLVGLDISLYVARDAPGETALYFATPLEAKQD